MKPAIFLDRDGVIIKNRANYVRSWDDVALIPKAVLALKRVKLSPYKIVIVTNQSVVGRGMISIEEAIQINKQLVAEITRYGGRIDGVWMCPHAPEARCDCRKPEPGLFLQAAHALALDLEQSIMVGDAITDLMAAQTAGVSRIALVRSGRGEKQLALASGYKSLRYSVYDNLLDALTDLIPKR
jgi:histidinol-phosphate phosphatase family protein